MELGFGARHHPIILENNLMEKKIKILGHVFGTRHVVFSVIFERDTSVILGTRIVDKEAVLRTDSYVEFSTP